jgi:cystine transport system substrate-binding protein
MAGKVWYKMKKTVKIIISLLLTMTIVASLAACASTDSSSPSSASTETAVENGSDADDFLAQLQSSGTIKVGTEGTFAPFSYHNDDDTLVGYDVELTEAVAAKLGLKVEWVETKWDSIIAGLDSKRFDMIANQVSITEDRLAKYDFSTPYTYTHGVIITAADNDSIDSFESLDGKNIATSLTSNWATYAEGFGAVLVGTNGFSESIDLVLSGRAEATINEDVTYYDYINTKPDNAAKLKIAATSDESSSNAFMVRKNCGSLVSAVNTALDELNADGTMAELSTKYFGTDITQK